MVYKITDISIQARNPDRVNVSVDGKFRFSLDVYQVTDLGIRVGQEIDNARLAELEQESQYGKLYAQSLEYCLMRPHSQKEVRDYLWKKTLNRKVRNKKGEIIERQGVSSSVVDRVYARLIEKDYVNDEKFALFWIQNRNLQKGTSKRKLYFELQNKGVNKTVIDNIMQNNTRDEKSEISKMIIKKRRRYPDDIKLTAYLVRQGFSYSDVREALSEKDQTD
jgi:regulatory protein